MREHIFSTVVPLFFQMLMIEEIESVYLASYEAWKIYLNSFSVELIRSLFRPFLKIFLFLAGTPNSRVFEAKYLVSFNHKTKISHESTTLTRMRSCRALSFVIVKFEATEILPLIDSMVLCV